MKHWIAGLLVLSLGLVPAPSRAQEQEQTRTGLVRYRAKKGDTLELLAAEYYGNRLHKIFIMVENDLSHDRPIRPGERLRIPISEVVTAAVGDSLPSLAAAYLGHERRGRYLAEFNGLKEDDTLAAGQSIIIPMRVTYRARGKELLLDIARNLFDDGSQAELLKNYNFLSADSLEPGQTISVPVPKVQVQASKSPPPDAESSARAAKRKQMVADAERIMPQARKEWLAGDFAAVKRELTKLDRDFLDTALAVEVGVLLGACYVAFDDEDSALAVFKNVLDRQSTYVLDEFTHSPKVRAVWDRAQKNRR